MVSGRLGPGLPGGVVRGAARLRGQAGHRGPEDVGVGDRRQVELLRADHQIRGDRQPVEQQREMVRRVHLAERHRGQQVRHLGDEPVVDVHLAQRLVHEPAERVRPGAGDQRRPAAVLRRGDRHVAGAAADGLAERLDVLQSHVVLQGIEVDADPSHGQHLEMLGHCRVLPFCFTGPAATVVGPAAPSDRSPDGRVAVTRCDSGLSAGRSVKTLIGHTVIFMSG